MSSQHPIKKSVKWRMKGWVSCFSPCRLPIADKENDTNLEISTPFPATTNVHQYQQGDQSRRQNIDEATPELSSNQIISSIEKKNTASSSRSQMSEEEYIELHFRDNREIHEGEDRKSLNQIQSEFANRKNRGNGKGGSGSVDKWLKGRSYRHLGEESNSEWKQEEGTHTGSPFGSNMSLEESNSSFTFPVLDVSRSSWEWMGGPVLIPRPEDAAPRLCNSKDVHNRHHFGIFRKDHT